ncbi:MMPL family transporter [Nocardioides dongxiaopingii]|uniref:MMPL family transporter n=1 Tax=Nocardioides sp. S-1144 TaxID=2582905 RepID=UPI00110EF455|nr:MMPL family transporter [Nocardioides sp. S-1144]QCW51328.1 MMPL family transporter [Nocardioides sp. S-1144]
MLGGTVRFSQRHRLATILAWLAALVAAVVLLPGLGSVTESEQAAFLPDSADSVAAAEVEGAAFPDDDVSTAVLVVSLESGAPVADSPGVVQGLVDALEDAGIEHLVAVGSDEAAVSEDGTVRFVDLSLADVGADESDRTVDRVREVVADATPEGVVAELTGNAALNHDGREAAAESELVISVATVVVILVLMLLAFRGILAALVPVLVVPVVYELAARVTAALASEWGWPVDENLPLILTVVLFGVGTDYVLFILFRFREGLREGIEPRAALERATVRTAPVLGSAALTVTIAFAALGLATLGFYRTLGPGLIVSVLLMFLAATTLVPAVLSLLGRGVFWPSRPWRRQPRRRLVGALASGVVAHAGGVATVVVVLMLGGGAAAVAFQPDFSTTSALDPSTESSRALDTLGDSLPAGTLNPTRVVITSDSGVDEALVEEFATGLAGRDLPGEAVPGPVAESGDAGQVVFAFDDDPLRNASLDAFEDRLRPAAESVAADLGVDVVLTGDTATSVDLRTANNRDLLVIGGVAAAAIMLGLVLALRGLVAGVTLVLAIVLGVVAALGAGVVLFQQLLGEPGLAFNVPIVLYVFVLAIGTDYTILVVLRIREERARGGDRVEAVRAAMVQAVPSVVAAGLILAGTFAALVLSGVPATVQLGATVAIGIVLAAGPVASVLMPAVAVLLGDRLWWPARVGPRRGR